MYLAKFTYLLTALETKYAHLSFVAKAALILSQSNASFERDFLVNRVVCWPRREEHCENEACRSVKEAIHQVGSSTKFQ